MTTTKIDASALGDRPLRYYDFAMAAFVAILLLSNLIGASKVASINVPFLDDPFVFGAGILFFPLSYVLGDVLTEVYGYARARRVIWTGFAALAFMAFMSWAVVAMPPAEGWDGQAAYESVFGGTWRIVVASISAFWLGEIANAFVMARMKLMTGGKHLWSRTIGSTVVGQGIDSLVFYPVAFFGIWETELIIMVMITNYVLKVVWEALLTPLTYAVVRRMKDREGVDIFDENTDFTPFRTKI
ncbi:queuosine precursor transporter [Pacificimonas sp. WHA3]|uniref:Probable queuosine precursor transporter n=1 Tax=Pacificimonas pallii TaxID=2827236 RepID=A0ABS6SD72_9SPHN|nr:queuosine precursor transporter [Pacificimonas pallii]MBV7256363.1 queuosine precursor transporter [Pacificimonas pallii]